MSAQGGASRDGVWWSPWPPGLAASALDAALQPRGQGLVVPAGAGAPRGVLCFALDAGAPEGLTIAAAAVHDRFGPPRGLVFLADPSVVAPFGAPTADAIGSALGHAADLHRFASALAPGRPWAAVFPPTRGRRAEAAAQLALRGAVEGLAEAARAAGGRAEVLDGPPSLWSGDAAGLGPLLAQLSGAPRGALRSLGARLGRKLRD